MIRTGTIAGAAITLAGLLPGVAAVQPAAAATTVAANTYLCESSAPQYCTGSDPSSNVVERNNPGKEVEFIPDPNGGCYTFEDTCWRTGTLEFYAAAGHPCLDGSFSEFAAYVGPCSDAGAEWAEYTGATHTEWFNVNVSTEAGIPQALSGLGQLGSQFLLLCPEFLCPTITGLQRFDFVTS